MSGTGGADIVHGSGLPSPRWWRRYKDIPLIVLAILSLIAALIGWATQYRLDAAAAQPAPVASSDSGDPAVATACRPPIAKPATEPWIDDDGAGEATWNANSAQLEDPVVLGRDGWAFYNDQIEQNFSQAIGRRYLTVAEAGAWHDYFAALQSGLADQGIELSIQISPSASSVYPQQLPEWTDGIRGSTPLDQFLAASPDLPIVDFRSALRTASESDTVYTPVNSHWTDFGGYVAWQAYARCHDATYPDSDALWVPSVSGVESTRIYNEYAAYGVADTGPEWTVPTFDESFADVAVTDSEGNTTTVDGEDPLDLSKLPAATSTEAAKTDQTALILRDSMGNALSPYWGQTFAKTWQIQHRYDDWSNPPNFRALVDQYHPDVVIVQLAERHLANAPAVGITPGY